MTTVRITDAGGNKPTFVQWDVDRALYITGVSSTPCLHFANAELRRAIVVQATNDNGRWKCLVPNFILQFALPMAVSVFLQPTNGEGHTVYTAVFPIVPKKKPQDYTYVENIGYVNWVVKSAEAQTLLDSISALRAEIAESVDAAENARDDAVEAKDAILDMTVSAETLAPGSSATVSKTETGDVVNLHFGIPRGATGATGDTGSTGAKGDDGDDGYSPTVTVTSITGGHRVTITDAGGSHSFDVMDGGSGSGTSNYNDLSNRPQINSVTLTGDKSASDLGLASASDTAALSDRIDALDDSRTHAMPFSIDGSGYINYSTGATGAAAVYDYTGYVDVSACTSIMYKRAKSTLASSSIGIAFYNASKTYISGERCLTSQEATGYAGLKTIDVPNNAVYARFSTYHDTTTYGDFELYGLYKTPVVDSELSSTSTNAIQNKAVKAALDAKGTYSKPSGGIPASDLASGVIPTVPLASIETPSDLGTAAVGSSTKYARADHVHKMPSASDVGAIMRPWGASSGDVLTWDGSAWIPEAPASVPSAHSSNPAMDGTASPGSSSAYARGDHVHPTDTSRAAASDLANKADKITEVTNSMSGDLGTVTLDPGKIYHFTGVITYVAIAFGTPAAGLPAHYHFDFNTSPTAPTVSIPQIVTMPNGFVVEANKHYEIDILNGYGAVMAW